MYSSHIYVLSLSLSSSTSTSLSLYCKHGDIGCVCENNYTYTYVYFIPFKGQYIEYKIYFTAGMVTFNWRWFQARMPFFIAFLLISLSTQFRTKIIHNVRDYSYTKVVLAVVVLFLLKYDSSASAWNERRKSETKQ